MSLAEQIQRVDGGQNDTLKAILTALGVTVGTQKIDQLAALAATISPKLKPDNLNSAETNALYGLGADAVPDDVLAKVRELIQETETAVSSKAQIVFGRVQQPTVSNITLPFEADCIFVCADVGESASVLYTTLTQNQRYVLYRIGNEVYFQLSGNLLKITKVNGSGVSIDYIAIKV